MQRETIKIDQTSLGATLGCVSWELHAGSSTSSFSLEVLPPPAAGGAREPASWPRADWLVREQPGPRVPPCWRPRLRGGFRGGVLLHFFPAVSFDNRQRRLRTPESSSLTAVLKLEEVTIWLKLRQDFPTSFGGKKITVDEIQFLAYGPPSI